MKPKAKPSAKKPEPNRSDSVQSKSGLTTAGLLGSKGAQAHPTQRIRPQWRWHYRTLLELRDRLLEQRGERRTEASQPLEPHSMDMADSATDEFDHDLALSGLSTEQDALYELDEALKRIQDGTYGVCQKTGRPISAARLKAIPWARFARDVEEQLEQKGGVRHRHLGQLSSVRGPAGTHMEEAENPEEEATEPAPKDEALWQVYSPPAEPLPGHKSARPPSSRTRPLKQKGPPS